VDSGEDEEKDEVGAIKRDRGGGLMRTAGGEMS